MLINHTTIRFDPAKRAEAMALVDDLVDRSRTEDGTVRYRAMTDVGDPDVVRFFEQYEDAAAAEAHAESEQYRRFVESLPELADGNVETIRIRADETDRVELTPRDAVDALD
ncbi:putative quinol monooxygenase [Halorubrum rutilum]|uniref:Quinol monooxygenase n=1 Tax=Halorubrum rutilum TaxID=1364933 RepID=A0ABD6AP07_9EURY|nr:antibiotic biosynthesis monooxygenase [Halorubrum rutilum]